MLTKSLVIALVILAVSPFTQPFSTITLGAVNGGPVHQHGWSDDVSAAFEDTGTFDFPSNPATEIAPTAVSERHGGLTLVASPAVDTVSAGSEDAAPLVDAQYQQHLQSALICPHAVLRI